jgi:hypothetical protein
MINGAEVLFTATQVATMCGVTSSAINDAAKAGKIHAVNEPGDGPRVVRRFTQTEAHRYRSAFLARQAEQAAKAAAKADRVAKSFEARRANAAKGEEQLKAAVEARVIKVTPAARPIPPMRLSTSLDAELTERQRGSLHSLLAAQLQSNEAQRQNIALLERAVASLEQLVAIWAGGTQ